MKVSRILYIGRLFLVASSLLAASQLRAAFSLSKGSLYVYQIGDGNTNGYATTTAATPIYIDQFSTNGILLSQVMLPTNGAVTIIASLNSGTEGSLSLSPASDALVFMAYTNNGSFPVGTAGVNGSQTITNTRSVMSVTANGSVFIAAASTNFYNRPAGAGRGAATDGQGNYWTVGIGTPAGLMYYGTNTTATNISATTLTGAFRSIETYGTNLYVTAGSALYVVPEANATNGDIGTLGAANLLITDSDGSGNVAASQGFVFNTNLTICYIAEGTTASGGGIRRYDYDANAAVWNYSYTISPISIGGTAFAFVTADFTGADPIVYATTLPVNGFGNSIVRVVDTGANDATTNTIATVIASAPTNNLNYNGIVFDSIATAAPAEPLLLISPRVSSGGFNFSLTNTANLSFKVYATTNIGFALSGWTLLGTMTENPASSGQYEFLDSQVINKPMQFYQVRWP